MNDKRRAYSELVSPKHSTPPGMAAFLESGHRHRDRDYGRKHLEAEVACRSIPADRVKNIRHLGENSTSLLPYCSPGLIYGLYVQLYDFWTRQNRWDLSRVIAERATVVVYCYEARNLSTITDPIHGAKVTLVPRKSRWWRKKHTEPITPTVGKAAAAIFPHKCE